MSMTTIEADISQCIVEFLHSESVAYFQERHPTDKTQSAPSSDDVIKKLEQMGYRIGENMVERISRDTPRFKNELDAVVFICKTFWVHAFNKQIDNLKTNHQDTYVLHDYNFRFLSHLSNSDQYKDKSPTYLAFTCGLLSGALTNLGIRCQVSADVTTMPACTFQVKVLS